MRTKYRRPGPRLICNCETPMKRDGSEERDKYLIMWFRCSTCNNVVGKRFPKHADLCACKECMTAGKRFS